MAIERNFCGFETADQGEILFGGSSGQTTPFRAFATTPVRTGIYALNLAPSGGVPTQLFFPSGAVTGTTSAGAKRVRARVYLQLTSRSFVFGNQAQRLFGLGTDAGYQNIVNNTSTLANTGISLWIHADGRHFLHVAPSSATNYNGAETVFGPGFTDNAWHEVVFDVSYDGAGHVTATVTIDGGTPISATNSVGTTLPKLAFGSGLSGAFAPTYVSYWDDLVYIATSGADAGSPITLPTETKVYPVRPTAVGRTLLVVDAGPDQLVRLVTGATLAGVVTPSVGNTWGGTLVADVNEIPVDTSGGSGRGAFFESSNASGALVVFNHATAAALGITSVVAWKVYRNGSVASGTGTIETLLGLLSTSGTWGIVYQVDGAQNPVGLLSWTPYTLAQFNAYRFGVRKQNGTQQTFLGNLISEVLGT